MKVKALVASLLLASGLIGVVFAGDKAKETIDKQLEVKSVAGDKIKETIAKRLQTVDKQFGVKTVVPAANTGLYEVELVSGEVIYSTADGQYIFGGTLFEVANGQLKNLTERKTIAKRVQALTAVKSKDMVVFQAKNQKAIINVFTDIDCGYCRKLHQEVPKLNELGVTVRYLAYPRAGVYADASKKNLTASFKKIKSVWCDENPTEAMTKAKTSGFIKDNLKCDAPIEAQFQLGQQIGVRGTPAIILENGEMLPGYMPAEEIAKRLKI
jgi:thiol:disulfide interchange protein DsbC